MPRKSSIKGLPPKVLAEVNRLLADAGWTLDQVVAHLEQAGHSRSRSALGRYKQGLDKVAEKLRRSREMAEALVREIGPSAVEGQTGRLLVEILQNLAFEFMLKRADDDEAAEELGAQEFMYLGRALKDLAAAQKIEADRELKIREQAAKDLVKKLDKAAESAAEAGEPGLSPERIDQLRRDFLGVRKEAA